MANFTLNFYSLSFGKMFKIASEPYIDRWIEKRPINIELNQPTKKIALISPKE